MPHIIVEFAEQLADDAEVDAILQTVHNSIAESGLFKANQIKTRAYPFRGFTNAGGSKLIWTPTTITPHRSELAGHPP